MNFKVGQIVKVVTALIENYCGLTRDLVIYRPKKDEGFSLLLPTVDLFTVCSVRSREAEHRTVTN